jgi:hypothetical protein
MPRKPITYRLIGYQQQRNTIGEWPAKLKKKIKKVVQKVAILDIETAAKQKLTIDGHVDTGRLRADIHTEYEGSPRRDFSKKIGELDALAGTNVEYAQYIERIDPYLTWAYRKAVPKLRKEIAKACDEFSRRGA